MKCCFCGKEIDGYGNNPSPFYEGTEERCCDACNGDIVIPARLVQLKLASVEDEQVVSVFDTMFRDNDVESFKALIGV